MLGPLKSCNKSGFIVFIVIYSTISCIRTCMWRAYSVDICRDSKKWVDDLGQGQCTSHLSVGPRFCRSLNIILKDWTIFVTTEIVFGSCPSQSFVSSNAPWVSLQATCPAQCARHHLNIPSSFKCRFAGVHE